MINATYLERIKNSHIGLFVASVAVLSLLLTAGIASAALVSGQDITAAPTSVIDSDTAGGAANTAQQAFDEQQGIVVPAGGLAVDSGIIPEGTIVNSHMIFLNKPDREGGIIDDTATWTFDGPILGVMSDGNGALEDASNGLLGATGTTYPGSFSARGLEGLDSYLVSGNSITVRMRVSQPGDWIRVVTAWTDRVPPVVTCSETTNPHGKNTPKASKSNQDGFYELSGSDNYSDVELYVKDIESGEVFGPFESGTKIKYTEANGATPSMSKIGSSKGQAGAVSYHIKGQGDFEVIAMDAAGNTASQMCYVPNPPK